MRSVQRADRGDPERHVGVAVVGHHRLTRNLTDWNACEKACVRHGVWLSADTGGIWTCPLPKAPTTAGWRRCGLSGKAQSKARGSGRRRIVTRGRVGTPGRVALFRVYPDLRQSRGARSSQAQDRGRGAEPGRGGGAAQCGAARRGAARRGYPGSSIRSGSPCRTRERRASSAPVAPTASRSPAVGCWLSLAGCGVLGLTPFGGDGCQPPARRRRHVTAS